MEDNGNNDVFLGVSMLNENTLTWQSIHKKGMTW